VNTGVVNEEENLGGRPVVIVGAGPTGVTAALLLARYGIPSVVLDRWTGVYAQPRAVHLDDEVHRILGRLGVDEEFAAISRPARGLRLVDRDLRVLAEFARDDAAGVHGYPQANMFDQPALEGLLRARMQRTPLVSFRGNVEVVDVRPVQDRPGRLMVHFDDVESGNRHAIEADHVLGCDGANSVVRQAMGSRMIDLGFEQRWLVIDVETDADIHQWDGVHQVCDRRRAATFMRIGQRRYRWEFRLLDGESLSDFESMSEIHQLIAPWTPGTPREQLRLIRMADYVFRARVADRWRRGGVFLLGDAAHLTPPFIGQGMGSGLRDANNLAWKLASVINGTLGATALDSYELERKPHARTMITTAIGIGLAMTGGGAVGEALRGLVFPQAHLIPALRRLVIESVSPRLRRSSLLARRRPMRASALVGTLAPNALLGTGKRLDSVADGYILVTRRAPSPPLEAELARRRIVTVTAHDDEPLGSWLRRARAVAAVVRPDFTVAIAGSDPRRMVAHLPLSYRTPTIAAPAPPGGSMRTSAPRQPHHRTKADRS
jgi:2-polyprenyl-6-methoxyphenol hydroxylase-like FAD-dependent oxidoreductase